MAHLQTSMDINAGAFWLRQGLGPRESGGLKGGHLKGGHLKIGFRRTLRHTIFLLLKNYCERIIFEKLRSSRVIP